MLRRILRAVYGWAIEYCFRHQCFMRQCWLAAWCPQCKAEREARAMRKRLARIGWLSLT
jgi:hypothetical protein